MNFSLFYLNVSDEQLEDQITFLKSFQYLDESRKINVIFTLIVIIFGLVGNSITICLFVQKRFRTNSNNVFLLCLALNDSFFLIIHLFEDTIRTIKEIFFFERYTQSQSLIASIVNKLNIVDNNYLACHSVNYLRYVLRFISAYIILAFTIQRLSIVISPFSKSCKSNQFAWSVVIFITVLSLIINFWVPFAFEIHTEDVVDFCEIKKEWKTRYFILTNFYIFAVIVVPMMTIFISNLLIIIKTRKASKTRQGFRIIKQSVVNIKVESAFEMSTESNNSIKHELNRLSVPGFNKTFSSNLNTSERVNSIISLKRNLSIRRPALSITRFDFKISPVYQNVKQLTNNNKTGHCLITKILLLVSISYAILNLPYLITWCLFYNEITFEKHEEDSLSQNRLFLAVKISEIMNILNYGVHFYFYCVSGSMFLNQLRYSKYFCWLKTKNSLPRFYFERVNSVYRKELTPV